MQVIERHHDYVIRNVTVAPNGSAKFVVRLDVDAPFALRSLVTGGLMSNFQFVITGYDDRRYAAGISNASTDSLFGPGWMAPIYPQVTFPIGMTIQIDITDISGAGTTNGVIAFRGTKLFPDGVVFGAKYPPQFSELMFRYPFNFTLASAGASPTVLLGQPLNIKSDADFVVRMLALFIQPGGNGYSLAGNDVILRDQYGKAYSNDFVPTHFLFPLTANSITNTIYPDATIYPEIYVVRNTQLLMDIRRTDSLGLSNVMNFVFYGSKIFPVSS
jgi:hypothetical protein